MPGGVDDYIEIKYREYGGFRKQCKPILKILRGLVREIFEGGGALFGTVALVN